MASRSAVGGALFTNSIAAIFMLTGNWIGIRLYGYTREVDWFQVRFMMWAMSALSLFGAVVGWRMFSRLQALDGRGTAIHFRFMPGATDATPTATRRDVGWLLIKKELRLQQLAWIVAGLYAVIYVTIVVSRRGIGDADNYAMLITITHGMIQSLLVGSLAGAEERHTGMHDTQLLLPMSSARQWMVKAGTAVAHMAILSIALPFVLSVLLPVEGLRLFGHRGFFNSGITAVLIAVTSISLYVSTLTASGLRALMVSFPVVFAIGWFIQRVGTRVSWETYKFFWLRDGKPMLAHAPVVPANTFFIAGGLALSGLVLWRALGHYRWTDRRPARIAGDAVLLAVAIVAYFALSGAVHLR